VETAGESNSDDNGSIIRAVTAYLAALPSPISLNRSAIAVSANTIPKSPKSEGDNTRASAEVAAIVRTRLAIDEVSIKAPPRIDFDFKWVLIVSVSNQ